jgi:ABC-2 type transport system ATP-binding protein
MGEDPRTLSGRTTVRRQLGYVPQETGFPRGFSAFSFVDYMAILKEWTDADVRHEEVRRVLGLVDLTDVAPKRVSALSGGQRRRLVLAQALLGRPGLLILDEPTAGLDPAQRGRLRDVLGRAGESATVVISTHQTEDVAALCERVIVLDGGQVLFDGRVVDLVEEAAGRVWMSDDRHPAARHAWRTGTGRVRNVGDPPPDAELIEPALEDAYLLLVGDAASDERLGAVS